MNSSEIYLRDYEILMQTHFSMYDERCSGTLNIVMFVYDSGI